MKKLKPYSPFDYQTASSPYQNSSKVRKSHGKQVCTAEERKNPKFTITSKEKSKSFENLSKKLRKDVKSAGDFKDASKEISEKFSEHKNLNSKACQTFWNAKKPALVVKWMSKHDGCHHLVSRRSSGNQRMLRYLLKLSNDTYYATLQHEIDVMKKEKKELENESTLHSHAILKILKNQLDDKQVIMSLIEQNQKLEHGIQRKQSFLEALSDDIRELKSRSNQPIFLTYVNHETILKEDTQKPMDYYPKQNKFQHKSSKSHPVIPTYKNTSTNSNPHSISAPIISRLDKDPQLSKTSIDSQLNYKFSNSDNLTDTEILSKHVSFQKTVATNYSINDCPSSLRSESSRESIKTRTWTKFFCCR